MNKKKFIIVILAIALVVVLAVIIVHYTKNNQNLIDSKKENIVSGESRLKNYIASLKENYYIYYTGEFKDINGIYKKASIYFSKSGKNYAIKSDDLSLHVVLKENKLYNISHTYKMVIVMNKDSLNLAGYNLISLDGKEYVKSKQEKIEKTLYYVEEYKTNEENISYYFAGDSLKKIQIQRDGKEQNVLFTVENTTRQDLFVINEDYEMTYA